MTVNIDVDCNSCRETIEDGEPCYCKECIGAPEEVDNIVEELVGIADNLKTMTQRLLNLIRGTS